MTREMDDGRRKGVRPRTILAIPAAALRASLGKEPGIASRTNPVHRVVIKKMQIITSG